jgi:hypothetical protein
MHQFDRAKLMTKCVPSTLSQRMTAAHVFTDKKLPKTELKYSPVTIVQVCVYKLLTCGEHVHEEEPHGRIHEQTFAEIPFVNKIFAVDTVTNRTVY